MTFNYKQGTRLLNIKMLSKLLAVYTLTLPSIDMLKQHIPGGVTMVEYVLNINWENQLKNPWYFQLEQVINYEQKQRLLLKHSQ